MKLSDGDIRQRLGNSLKIDPLDEAEQIQPGSVDVRLASDVLISRADSDDGHIEIGPEKENDRSYERAHAGNGGVRLNPGDFALAETVEHFSIPPDLIAELRGRSSIGRLGVQVHSTAGLLDPGWSGTITMEISITENDPVVLHAGTRVAQVTFDEMKNEAEIPYGAERGSKYQDQEGPTPSRIHEDSP